MDAFVAAYGKGHRAGTWNRRLNLGRNCFNTALACSIVVAPASRSSVISRSWKVPAARSTRVPWPLCLRREFVHLLSTLDREGPDGPVSGADLFFGGSTHARSRISGGTRCLGGRRRRGLLRPASSRMRRRVVRPMSMPSRSASSSLRYLVLAKRTTRRITASGVALNLRRPCARAGYPLSSVTDTGRLIQCLLRAGCSDLI